MQSVWLLWTCWLNNYVYCMVWICLNCIERRLGENRNIMKQYETSDFEVRWDMMGYRFRISLVNLCNVCRDVSRKCWPCREQTRDQLLRAQHSAASFSSSAAWFTSAAKWTDTKLTGELQAFSLKSSPETCLGRRSHAEDPPLHEACLPSLSTRNVTDIDMDINGPPGRVSTNASEHAMLHNMLLPRHPKTRNQYGACWSIWTIIMGMRCNALVVLLELGMLII